MSEVKVNKISPRSGTTVTLGDSGDTFTIPSGATINNQGTATNFGATGSASWSTTVKTSTFTAVAGEGYFIDTSSGAVTVNLPAGSAGAVIAIKDYLNTFDTNNVTVSANGSEKIGGLAVDATLSTEGIAVTFIYIDSTRGWLVTDDGLQSSLPQTYDIQYLVVAGGGGGGGYYGGGGGAGGLLTATLSSVNPGITLTATVGGGGASVSYSGGGVIGNDGVNSSLAGPGISTVTATAGGGGGMDGGPGGRDGGSGGGGAGSTGNAPTAQGGGSGTSPQGNDGGNGSAAAPDYVAGGGGGAGAVGTNGAGSSGGDGGVGVSNSITGSAVYYAGGGGGSSEEAASKGPGGNGGGGDGGHVNPVVAGGSGTANTGGGGGGSNQTEASGAGGTGVVILSVPDASYSGTVTGSPTVATGVSGKTVITFTGTGTYVT